MIALAFIGWFYDNSVDGRSVHAPIMMAKSHKRALYYTVVWIHIHVCTPQNFIFAKKLWGTYATKTFYVYIAWKSISLCYFILVMMRCFQCSSSSTRCIEHVWRWRLFFQEIFFWKPQEIVSHSLSFQMFLRKSFVFQWRWVSGVLPEF